MTEGIDEPGAQRERQEAPARPQVAGPDEVHGMTEKEVRAALPGAEEDLEALEAALADARARHDIVALGYVEALHARLRTLEEGDIRGG